MSRQLHVQKLYVGVHISSRTLNTRLIHVVSIKISNTSYVRFLFFFFINVIIRF